MTADEPIDGRVHAEVLRRIVEQGYAPSTEQIGRSLARSSADVEASLRRLHDGHGLVLHPGTSAVWIAHPFSLSPTAAWVAVPERGWWAPCIWCATGVVALAAPNGIVHTRAGGEAEPLAIRFREGEPVDADLVVHFALPPRDAWQNVVHYCATVLPFRRAEDVAGWCARHGMPQGAIVPLAQVVELGRAWYGRHLDASWRKWTVAEAQAIFDRVRLTDAFWRLPTGVRAF